MGIGSTELILILLVALLLFGAKNLPKIARDLGKSMAEFRRAANEVKRELMQADVEPSSPPAARPPAAIEAPVSASAPAAADEPKAPQTAEHTQPRQKDGPA